MVVFDQVYMIFPKTIEKKIVNIHCSLLRVIPFSFLRLAQDIVEVEVEYDPILGNVKSTRKRSSTIITKIDNDYPSNRHQSVNNRYKLLPIDSGNETTPIWARRRISHSTVKPSDLVREYDKREKLDATAFRRLSRAGKNRTCHIQSEASLFYRSCW